MSADKIIQELQSLGDESTKQTLMRHGAREPFFGVKVVDLKKIRKRIKTDHQLALDLYATGNSDAMYLAGMIVDDHRMTKTNLRKWAREAYWSMIGEYTVPGVAAGGSHGWSLGLEWIEHKQEGIQACGWSTLSAVLAVKPDDELDFEKIEELLNRIESTIHDQLNRVRYAMNSFVISVGAYVASMSKNAIQIAAAIGKVHVSMGDTACKVPDAVGYIKKIEQRGSIGEKRKTAKC
ncbi:MAG: DNA alkylation repair protein [Planctomycetota bacterium]|nr:DNA alkylation repair protein [Planctomycetota bacterium]